MNEEVQSREEAVSVLVIAGLTRDRDGKLRTEKLDAHVRPMAMAAAHVTYLTANPVPTDTQAFECRRVASSSFRPLEFIRLALAGVRLARTGQYDLIASFSLIPYGCFALLAGLVSGRPTHLGIIGMDMDVHADGLSGPFARWAFRRFDAISIAGSGYAERLTAYGVAPDRIHTILHPVDRRYAVAAQASDPTYGLLWIGRMSPEKDPVRFVRIVEALCACGVEPSAVMVGDGPSSQRVQRRIADAGLSEVIDLPGWEPEPLEYYRQSRLTVLTSQREMLPLTLVESMLVGVPPVAPPIGAIPDVVEDGLNGFVVADRDVESYVSVIADALADPERSGMMGKHATGVRDELTVEAVAESWANLFAETCQTASSHLPMR